MLAPVFVDTNVFLYARDAGEVDKQPRAAAWPEYLWREQIGRTSVQVLSEYYVNVTRKLSPELAPREAWDDVQALLT
jgi:predicted nucleic acid-binding protein